MADLDVELANRLSRLADAVPLSGARLDPVHRGAIEARQRVRMAWVTPLVFVVVAVLLTSMVGFGPFAPGATDGPVSATTRSGDFELTIRSARSRYSAGEPIEISASLTYLGQDGPIEIGHDIGQDGLPIGFGVKEPIFPGFHLSGGVSRLTCHRSTLSPLQPLNQPFSKTGGGSGGDSAGFVAYMRDPVLWLTEGTWHAYATARFSTDSGPLGSCGAEAKLQAEIAILVVPLLNGRSLAPDAPSLPPKAGSERWKSSVTEGNFELTLAAAKAMFSADETLDVVASLVYLGPEEHVVIHHLTWGPLGFGMVAPGIITLSPRGRWSCDDLEMTRGVPITEALLDLGNGGTPFTVPHGLHEITSAANFGRGGCEAPADTMATSIVVAVADGPDDIPLFTANGSEAGACLLMRGGGRLVTSDTGLGVVDFRDKVRDVFWPTGYSARRAADGAVLVGRSGQVIAREGDLVGFDALMDGDRPLWPCGEVEVYRGESPPSAVVP